MDIKYCRKCGMHLKLTQKKLIGYTAEKGKEIHKAYLECPLRSNGWFDPHDRWEGTVIEGEEGIFRYDMKYSDF